MQHDADADSTWWPIVQPAKVERNKAIVKKRLTDPDATYDVLAAEFHITRENIRGILLRYVKRLHSPNEHDQNARFGFVKLAYVRDPTRGHRALRKLRASEDLLPPPTMPIEDWELGSEVQKRYPQVMRMGQMGWRERRPIV